MQSIIDFEIQLATEHYPQDADVEQLLKRVYVGGGFTDANIAKLAFTALAVRRRGELLVANLRKSNTLIGMVIVVAPDSPASKLAAEGEAELHLLAVLPEFRKQGVGRALIDAAMKHAKSAGFDRMLLWTQPTMKDAHRLYRETGFERRPELDFEQNGRDFMVLVVQF